MKGQAPDFSRGYPSRGSKLGPAWRDAWRALRRDRWVDGRSLAEEVAERHGLHFRTVQALLAAGCRAAFLERRDGEREVGHRGRGPTEYRIARTWRPGVSPAVSPKSGPGMPWLGE